MYQNCQTKMPNLSKFDEFLDREAVIDSRPDSAGGSELFHKMEVNELSRQSVGLENKLFFF